MPELGSYGSVRGARGNSRPYREHRVDTANRSVLTHNVAWLLDNGATQHVKRGGYAPIVLLPRFRASHQGKRRSYARSSRPAPAAVHGSAPELASAGAAGHLAEAVRQQAIRTTLGAPKSYRRISALPAANRANFAATPSMFDQEVGRRTHVE